MKDKNIPIVWIEKQIKDPVNAGMYAAAWKKLIKLWEEENKDE